MILGRAISTWLPTFRASFDEKPVGAGLAGFFTWRFVSVADRDLF